jgi:ribose 5-phosphate isomerase B
VKLAIGADHAAYRLKEDLAKILREGGHEVQDFGTHDESSTDYPDYAHAVARAVVEGSAERGLLVCGTGVGMSIAANRHRGARAVACSEPYSARMGRGHNDANILCMGARVVALGLAADILQAFLDTPFEGGRHSRRVQKLDL